MAVYTITKQKLLTFATKGKPFLSFDQFNNIVRHYRDEYYAAENIQNFANDIGIEYNLWTVDTHNNYFRNVFFHQIKKPIFISLNILKITKFSSFPIEINIFDTDGSYFKQHQNIAVQKKLVAILRFRHGKKYLHCNVLL